MLRRALRQVGRGFYVDIGAYDPVVDSVSMGFYEQGWRGVHVEPVESNALRLRERRPDEVIIQAAVGAVHGTLKLFEIPGTGLSTADRDAAVRHEKAGFAVREIEVPCLTLEEVLSPHAGEEVHWLKIDVEGGERGVLEGWGSGPEPWIVVVESTSPLTQSESHHEWEPLILQRGYQFAYFDGLNRFYVSPRHADLTDAFRHGPSVFDDFTLSGTTTASYCVKLNARVEESKQREMDANRVAAEAAIRSDNAMQLVRKLEHQVDATKTHAAAVERQALDAEMRAQAAEKHIAAMTQTISWRVTAPLRKVRQLGRRAARHANMGRSWQPAIRGTLALAKRSHLYGNVAPWMRERYPTLWLRVKRLLLDLEPPIRAVNQENLGDQPDRAPIRNYVPHNSGDARLDAIAGRGSITVEEIQSLLEIEISRPRKE